MSLDGRFVAFSSAASDIVAGDTNDLPMSSSAIACCRGPRESV